MGIIIDAWRPLGHRQSARAVRLHARLIPETHLLTYDPLPAIA